MTRVLLISSGLVHPPFAARRLLRRALQEAGPYEFHALPGFEALRGLGDLGAFRAAVVYLHHREISAEALALFERFVAQGGGVLAVHSATASFKRQTSFSRLLGGRFTGYPPIGPFTALPAATPIEPFTDVPAFSLVDELYLHELEPDVQVHFHAVHEGRHVPVVWTRRHGRGKVCYASPGHRTGSLRDPTFREVLRRGLAWASA